MDSSNLPVDVSKIIDIKTAEQLQAEFDKVFLLEDRYVVKAVAAFVMANKNGRDPLWMFLVGPSSGGKTELVNALEKLKWVHPIDTLTVNTFASGQQRAGKETSLLLKVGSGILTFKDFTSILEMNKDARKEIMSQLRGIFDGSFVKRTGTGEDIKWNGKLGFLAAVTSIIHQKASEFSSMGERFVQYAIVQPGRKEVQRRIFLNSFDIKAKREHIQDCFKAYIEYVITQTQDEDIQVDDETKEEIIELADFCTRARSGLSINDRTGKTDFIPDVEMPTRVTSQLITLAAGLITLNTSNPDTTKHGILLLEDKVILTKIALDSVPRKRRQALMLLAEYKLGATAAAVATKLNYETEVMKQTLQELCSLGLAKRISRRDTYFYVLLDEYRGIIEKFEKIIAKEEDLEAEAGVLEDSADADRAIDDAFDIIGSQFKS